jgi:hypothetical protein
LEHVNNVKIRRWILAGMASLLTGKPRFRVLEIRKAKMRVHSRQNCRAPLVAYNPHAGH